MVGARVTPASSPTPFTVPVRAGPAAPLTWPLPLSPHLRAAGPRYISQGYSPFSSSVRTPAPFSGIPLPPLPRVTPP